MKYRSGGKNMKKQRKIGIIVLLGISFLLTMLTIENYAVDDEKNNTNIQNSTNTQTNATNKVENNTNNVNQEIKKSNNANLSNLGIRPHDFTGFRYGTTTYEVAVPEDTEEVEVYAQAQHEKATVTGTGKKQLKIGENKVEVVVTAEDGTKKTYTINIIRDILQETAESNEEGVNPKEENGLSNLKINDLELSPEFKTDIYEYRVKYIGEDTKLQIEAKPTAENYVVDVIGNQDLEEGENTITILVSEKNGDNVATYQVIVNKSLVDLEAIAKAEAQKKELQQKILWGAIAVIVILGIIAIFLIRRKRKSSIGKDWEEDSYEKEEETSYQEDIPKALRKKKNKKDVDLEEDELIENMPKDVLKERFLNNYSNYEEDRPVKKRKSKGKRFKEE